jgi:photosystem II stability/assembly factor-like uncharacterized protein
MRVFFQPTRSDRLDRDACLVNELVVLSSADGGKTWTRHTPAPGALPNTTISSWMGQPLACPTVTTCYLLSYRTGKNNPNPLPGPVLATHDAGRTWRGSVVSRGADLLAIACATAQACRVTGEGIFATDDGRRTWQRQVFANGMPAPWLGIACPAVDTCYAVGLQFIVATHPPR